jgi:hypothetical protein
MTKRGLFTLTSLLMFFFCEPVRAQDHATLKITSVGPGQNTGDLVIQGTLVVDAGWTTFSLTVFYNNAGGGVQKSQTVAIAGNWTTTVPGLASGGSYDVVAQVIIKMGQSNTQLILSDPANGKAK